MNDFNSINFLGTFRSYQQRVLDASDKYLRNNKIHIVAAPGSGKTILGLELIRRLNSPCLVLSPTNTIRYQWGDRFEKMFLPKGANVDDYVSFDLFNVKPITSITYQALHSAIDKIAYIDDDKQKIDYSDIDLFKLVNDYGIKTICVDEAHHLQNKWQKALEIFIGGLKKDVKIIALTATPPYDASKQEWNRYIKICGEIDEEIFVTELVKEKNLCPHQDYVYLNYPTEEESNLINKYKTTILNCLKSLKELNFFDKISKKVFSLIASNRSEILDESDQYLTIFTLLDNIGIEYNKNKLKKFFGVKVAPQTITSFEIALNLLLDNEFILSKQEKNKILLHLKKFGLIEKNKAHLQNNAKIEKTLMLSLGKLDSITKIVAAESENLKTDLRMLILTDFIQKSTLQKIGTSDFFKEISVVSIFETIRRKNSNLKLAILSGSLVVLPTELKDDIKLLLGEKAEKVTTKQINSTPYSEFVFNLSNKEKVSVVGSLFEKGKVNLIVGTKSLLGEGWDSPCINSLIMASFVGSFMLSNQMRGRAIRTHSANPNKTANIWHLVTLEPKDGASKEVFCDEETSSDYKTLKRRFSCFVGPNYTTNNIESGIERLTILQDYYTQESAKKINKNMENLATDRKTMTNKWIQDKGSDIMYMQSTVPFGRTPKVLGALELFKSLFLLLLNVALVETIIRYLPKTLIILPLVMLSAFMFAIFSLKFFKFIKFSFAKPFIKSLSKDLLHLLKALKHLPAEGKLLVEKNKSGVSVVLKVDNIKQQKLFLNTLQELLSPTQKPRYIICSTFLWRLIFRYSYNVPNLVAQNKNLATFARKRLHTLSPSKLIYANDRRKRNDVYKCITQNYLKSSSKPIINKQTSI